MFGLIGELRKENEELHAEKLEILQREAATIDAYWEAIERAKKAETELEHERKTWKEKYSALYEKYLNLLERYEKALKANTPTDTPTDTPTGKDINVRSKGVE